MFVFWLASLLASDFLPVSCRVVLATLWLSCLVVFATLCDSCRVVLATLWLSCLVVFRHLVRFVPGGVGHLVRLFDRAVFGFPHVLRRFLAEGLVGIVLRAQGDGGYAEQQQQSED